MDAQRLFASTADARRLFASTEMCIRDSYSAPPKAQAGYNIQIKETTRDNPSMLLWESEDVTTVSYTHLDVYKRQPE